MSVEYLQRDPGSHDLRFYWEGTPSRTGQVFMEHQSEELELLFITAEETWKAKLAALAVPGSTCSPWRILLWKIIMTAKENKILSSCSERACWPLSKPEMERPKQGRKISHEKRKTKESLIM